MQQKPWEHAKSAGSETDPLATRFVASLDYDTRLYKVDIRGSLAHAAMLADVGLISDAELKEIRRGLTAIEKEIEAAGVTGWAGWKMELEDVHMCIEAALIEKIGDAGRKLHTGRSRNDQVALDLALWVEDAGEQVAASIDGLMQAFVQLAREQGTAVMPSYTHLQRAQPICVGGELLAWCEALDGCADRFDKLTFRNPLGSGAIAGSMLPLDRVAAGVHLLKPVAPNEQRQILDETRRLLGATGQADKKDSLSWQNLQRMESEQALYHNAIFATASRDVAIDFVYGLSMTAMWLSRWAEQWILYATSEFNFIRLDARYTTGSSMMPQKQNPDMLELIRGRCGNLYGHLMALLTMCKGITIGYNRDLQEDKRHLFAAYDTVMDCLAVATGIVRTSRFNAEHIQAGLDRGLLDATAMAEFLVTKGMAFRTSHQVVGAMVRACQEKKLERLADLDLEAMNHVLGQCAHVPHGFTIDKQILQWLGAENVVKRYQSHGNAGLSGFEAQLQLWSQHLDTSEEE